MKKKIISILLTALVGSFLLTSCGAKKTEFITNVTEENVVIDGITGEYDLLFLTDLHMVIPDKKASKEVREYADSRYPMFQSAEGVPARDKWDDWIAYANSQKVDAVLFGGDIIDSPSTANLKSLEEGLSNLDAPYLFTIGNHDWTYPWDYMTENGREQHLTLLYPYLKEDSALQVLDMGEFYVVSVDDCTNQVNETIFPAYEELLQEGKPVIVITHVPFLTDSILVKTTEVWQFPVVIGGGEQGGIYPNAVSEKFLKITCAMDSPVAAVLAGHVHLSDSGEIKGEKDIPQFVGAPAYEGAGIKLHIQGNK